jgi:hypothetical protein
MSEGQKAPSTQHEIRVSGHLSPERAKWFGGMALATERTPSGDATTVLSGPVIDRAALFGTLNRIRDLGLKLISVNPIVPDIRDATCKEISHESDPSRRITRE